MGVWKVGAPTLQRRVAIQRGRIRVLKPTCFTPVPSETHIFLKILTHGVTCSAFLRNLKFVTSVRSHDMEMLDQNVCRTQNKVVREVPDLQKRAKCAKQVKKQSKNAQR